MAGAWGAAVPRGDIQLTSNPPEAEPQGRTWALAPGRPARPWPARAPLTAGPGGAAALTARLPLPALRAAGASPGAALLRRARGRGAGSGRWPRGQGQLACAPRRSGSGASPGPAGLAGGGGGAGSSPRPRGGGRGEGSGEARPRFPEGRALPTGGAGRGRCPARALAALSAAGAACARPASRAPKVRGRNSRVRACQAGTVPIAAPLARTLPGRPRGGRGRLRLPSTGRSGSPTRKPLGTRAPPAALTPRADGLSAAPSGIHHRARFWAVLDNTRTAVFSSFSFFLFFFR